MPVSLFKSKFKDARSSLFGLGSAVGAAPLSEDTFAPLFGDAAVDVVMAGAPLSDGTVAVHVAMAVVPVAPLLDDTVLGSKLGCNSSVSRSSSTDEETEEASGNTLSRVERSASEAGWESSN